jgi:ABC-type uncharacterized transport system auxiliary subunit
MKRTYINLFLLIATMLAIIPACTKVRVEPTKWYILEYRALNLDRELLEHGAVNTSLKILDAEIPSTYNRRQIVIKTSENLVYFDNRNQWADRLPQAFGNLVYQRIHRYNLVNRVAREYQATTRFELATNINAIEFLKFGSIYAARLNVDLHLRRTSDNLTVFQHSADRTRQIFVDNTEMFVQTINDLLMEEVDIFLKALLHYMHEIEAGVDVADRAITSRTFLELPVNENRRLELIEEEQIGIMGRLFIPSRTDPDYEPMFYVEDMEENYIGSYLMGSEVHLQPGKYRVFLGTGTTSQRVVEEVEIFSKYKTLLEPDAGWLMINIIDNMRNQVDQRYELFDLNTGESMGFGWGIKEGVGQQLSAWIIKPGHYKVVLNGNPFNTFEDFATVEVKRGEVEQLTIVVTENPPHRLVGAGRIMIEDFYSGTGRTSISIMNHLNANFMSRNDVQKDKNSFSMNIIEQLDTKIVADYFPFHYTMKNLLEIGVAKDNDTDMMISNDKFDLRNTLIYYIFRNFGIYGRADMNTRLFDEYVVSKDEKIYQIRDKDGNSIGEELTDKFHTKKAFTPLTFKQGAGLNYRMMNRSRANVNLRAGLGFRQDFHGNALYFSRRVSTDPEDRDFNPEIEDDYYIYRRLSDVNQRGIEFSAIGNFQIFRDLNYSMNIDYLAPFDNNDSQNFEMENILNLRMFKYLSWDYRLNLDYNKNVRDYVLFDHTLFLRFTYIFVK